MGSTAGTTSNGEGARAVRRSQIDEDEALARQLQAAHNKQIEDEEADDEALARRLQDEEDRRQ